MTAEAPRRIAALDLNEHSSVNPAEFEASRFAAGASESSPLSSSASSNESNVTEGPFDVTNLSSGPRGEQAGSPVTQLEPASAASAASIVQTAPLDEPKSRLLEDW